MHIAEAQRVCQPFKDADPALDIPLKTMAIAGEVGELQAELVHVLQAAMLLGGKVGSLLNREVKVDRGTMVRNNAEIATELADILVYVFLLGNLLHIDVQAAFEAKLALIRERFAAGYYAREEEGVAR